MKTTLTELSSEAMKASNNDPEVRVRMAQTCEELGMMEMAAVWRKAAELCRDRAAAPATP